MAVVSIILGILLVICGFSIMFSPLLTFLGVGTLLAIVLLIWGIMAVVRGASTKIYGLTFVLAIISIILGFLLLISPAATFETDMLILYLAAVFVIVRGLVAIIQSVKSAKGNKSKKWIWGIVLGILAVILGIFCMANPLFEAAVIGFLVAFYFIYVGFDMIYLGANDSGNGGAVV